MKRFVHASKFKLNFVLENQIACCTYTVEDPRSYTLLLRIDS